MVGDIMQMRALQKGVLAYEKCGALKETHGENFPYANYIVYDSHIKCSDLLCSRTFLAYFLSPIFKSLLCVYCLSHPYFRINKANIRSIINPLANTPRLVLILRSCR